MADLYLEIDTEKLAEAFGEIGEKVKFDLRKGVETLALATRAKTQELARDELGSIAEIYLDNLDFTQEGETVWVMTLKKPAMWIEEGRKSGFMEELLNGKSAKTNKQGQKYAVIPFKHNKGPARQSAKAQELAGQIKEAMRQKNIEWGKIEKNQDGSPRIRKLHSFNVESARAKPEHKNPLTYGVTVYQTKREDGTVRRDIMTFRVISEKHKDQGLWIHPGRTGANLFEKAHEWAQQTWENQIMPEILKEYE